MANTVFTQIGNVVGTEIQNLKDTTTADLTAEQTARVNADSSLTTSINNEILNRINSDNTLDNAITALENALNIRVSSLETLTTSNDLNLDTIQEIVTFIKDNRADLDSINLDWSAILNKPSTFTPSVHTHTISEVTDFNPVDYLKASTKTISTSTPSGGVDGDIWIQV